MRPKDDTRDDFTVIYLLTLELRDAQDQLAQYQRDMECSSRGVTVPDRIRRLYAALVLLGVDTESYLGDGS